MIRSGKSLAKYLDPELRDIFKTLPRDKPFQVSDIERLPCTPSKFAATLRKYDLARHAKAHDTPHSYWVWTSNGTALLRHLHGDPLPEKEVARAPKYVDAIKDILAHGPASKAAISKELDVFPCQLKASFYYLQSKNQAKHEGEGPASRWILVEASS